MKAFVFCSRIPEPAKEGSPDAELNFAEVRRFLYALR
jgi:hypothetical protein